jgi:hypothetical protein
MMGRLLLGRFEWNLRSNWRNISQKVLGTLTVE